MEQERTQERSEVFERIPWEMLEPKRNDRQWLVIGLAGAVVLGALAYTVVGGRAPEVPPLATAPPVSVAAAPVPPPAPPPVAGPAPTQPAMVTAEADLYAVDPERVVDRVVAHAEWFVTEYLTVDGSEQSRQILTALLPQGTPLPVAADGVRVFVEWVRAYSVAEVAPLRYRVEVLARTLVARGEDPYTRQPPLRLGVVVGYAGEAPAVLAPPSVEVMTPSPAPPLALVEVPPEQVQMVVDRVQSAEVLGGAQRSDGSWEVVVLAPSPDGVTRPQTVLLP